MVHKAFDSVASVTAFGFTSTERATTATYFTYYYTAFGVTAYCVKKMVSEKTAITFNDPTIAESRSETIIQREDRLTISTHQKNLFRIACEMESRMKVLTSTTTRMAKVVTLLSKSHEMKTAPITSFKTFIEATLRMKSIEIRSERLDT
ncbi:hypothetical protein Tco_0294954 [Tanacetum coccineum]